MNTKSKLDKKTELNSDDQDEKDDQADDKPAEDGCPSCKKKNKKKSASKSPAPGNSKAPKGDKMQVKPDGTKKAYKQKKVPKKPVKMDHCAFFKLKKGDYGSERTTLGVPPSTKISVDMKLTDMDKICTEPEKKPKAIIDRLKD